MTNQTETKIKWRKTAVDRPKNGALCECILEDGTQTNLIYDANLWWVTDRKMYVYFSPVFWRPL